MMPLFMDRDLEEIVSGCKAGSEKAYHVLFTRYYCVLLGVAMRYVKDRDEAKDILQESFIKIFKNISSYSERNSFEGWMKRIVQNTAINQYRRNLRFDNNAEAVLEKETDKEFENMISGLNAKSILALLHKLPDGYRTIINLYLIDGYSHPEIASMLGISAGTSKSQLFKARKFLKELLASDLKLFSA